MAANVEPRVRSLPRFLFEPWMIRWMASVSPGVGHLLARQLRWSVLFWALGSVVDFFAVRSFRQGDYSALSLFALAHFVVIGICMVHVERFLPGTPLSATLKSRAT